jgi:hypothetical protein
MIRTQVQLTEEQSQLVKTIAASEGVSLAEIIRRSIDQFIRMRRHVSQDEQRRRALAVVGKYASEAGNVSDKHDHYLAEIYGGQVGEDLR